LQGELAAARDKERHHAEELYARDSRAFALEGEAQALRQEKMLCQEEAARERNRANELDMAVTSSNFKLQDLAQQLDAQTAVARQVPILKDENLRMVDAET
jgi:hypothetical protein